MSSNYECDDKMVSHPSHYQSKNGLEVIDVIEAFTANLTGIEATDTGNVIRYICRWKGKNGLQDLKKAMWYLQHLINHVEGDKPIEPDTLNGWREDSVVFKVKSYEQYLAVQEYIYKKIIDNDVCTKADIHTALGQPHEGIDEIIGWNELSVDVESVRRNGNWYVMLPNPRLINEKESN